MNDPTVYIPVLINNLIRHIEEVEKFEGCKYCEFLATYTYYKKHIYRLKKKIWELQESGGVTSIPTTRSSLEEAISLAHTMRYTMGVCNCGRRSNSKPYFSSSIHKEARRYDRSFWDHYMPITLTSSSLAKLNARRSPLAKIR